MAAMAATEATGSNKAAKRERGGFYLQDIEANQHKRPRHSLLPVFLFEEEIDTFDTIQDDTVLHVMKSLEEEISITPKISTGNVEVGRTEASVGSYEYLVSATDDELGIPPSPPTPSQEINGQPISQNFWSDLLEISSDQKTDLLHPILTYCYSNNYRDFEVYGSDIPESDSPKWYGDEASTDSLLQECLTLI